MSKRFKTKATYEDGFLKPANPIELNSGDEVELIIIKEERLTEDKDDLTNSLLNLADKNPSFDFLNKKEEDIYSVKDLKKRYK